MKKNVTIVSSSSKDMMYSIFDEYMHELSQFDPNVKFDDDGHVIYKWFYDYWQDKSRYPFYYMIDGDIAGIAMVRDMEDGLYEMAEFYVKPEYRGGGNAMDFATTIIDMFMGNMDISTRHSNPRAIRFWTKVVGKYTFDTHDDEEWRYWLVKK